MPYQQTPYVTRLAQRSLTTIALASAALCGGAANAADASPDSLSSMFAFNGFGTLGAVRSNADEAYFVRFGQVRGAGSRPSLNVDSNLGLQLTASPTKWLSATVQVLSRERANDHITAETEWAFVKVTPLEGLAIRLGRMGVPMFAISEFRNVGYSNTWVRPPGEVYGLGNFEKFDGGDVSYRMPLGSTSLTIAALAGKSKVAKWTIENEVKDVKGVTMQWESDWLTLRMGKVQGTIQLDGTVPPSDAYTFSGLGVIVDRDNLVGQAEYVTRRSGSYGPIVDADGWYVLAGYHYKTWLPYATYGKTTPKTPGYPVHLSGAQATVALGVRWDAFKSTAIKFQLERINTQGTSGINFTPRPLPAGPFAPPLRASHVTAVSVAADCVF